MGDNSPNVVEWKRIKEILETVESGNSVIPSINHPTLPFYMTTPIFVGPNKTLALENASQVKKSFD
jgi:hypothetical protein